MFAPSRIELSKSALRQNIQFLKDYIGDDTIFCSVVKGNAYGHGIQKFVPMAEACGVRYFGVFSADEARRAFEACRCSESHVMIMGMIDNAQIPWAIKNEVSFYVFEIDRLQAAVHHAKNIGAPARIHLDLETGMNRLGLDDETLSQAVDIITQNEAWLDVMGACTHYAGAENVSNHERVTTQIEHLKSQLSFLKAKGIEPTFRHSACSAATLNYPETIMDMVRIGIAHYGFWPNRETYMKFLKKHRDDDLYHDPLKRVLSWKSTVMSTKKVAAGEYIGYGETYQTSREEMIASVPIGYSHGFKRSLTNMGIVLINGHRAPVAGLVNMNLLTIDVTDIPDVSKGDEVVIIGHQGDQEMTVASFSAMTNNMNYEVLVQIPSYLPRQVVE